MLKNLKISTGINVLLYTLIICIVAVSTYGLMSASSSSENFERSEYTTTNLSRVNSAIMELYHSNIKMNAFLLAKAQGQSLNKADIDNVALELREAKETMNKFISGSFSTTEAKTLAINVQKSFENNLSLSLKKMDALDDQSVYIVDMADEEKQRDKMQEQLKAYLSFADERVAYYSDVSQQNTQQMIVISVVALVLSTLIAVVAHFWLKNAIFIRLTAAINSFRLIASGNLSEKISIGAHNEIGQMLHEVEQMRLSLTNTVYGIRSGVKHIYNNAQDIASSNNDLSSRTEQQASALQETAASMEELKITVRQNADNAHSAKQLAESASGSAQKGGEVMKNLDKIMTEITVNSRQIADINSVIDSIANQTNILALNAAVEAARAGEQGRGFAVVAGEVRNLAKRSADAAKEIRQLINTCVANMNTGSQEVELAGSSMQEIVKSVIQVTDIMAEIASASDEQSTGINQIAQAVNEMDLVTQQNATMVENAAKTATSVEEHAGNLDEIVAQFVINEQHVSAVTREKNNEERVRPAISLVKKDQSKVKVPEDQWETF